MYTVKNTIIVLYLIVYKKNIKISTLAIYNCVFKKYTVKINIIEEMVCL